MIRAVLFFALALVSIIVFSPLLGFFAILWWVFNSQWAWRNILLLDHWFNVFWGPVLNSVLKPQFRFGFVDETPSSVIGKNLNYGEHFVIIDRVLSFVLRDADHSVEAIEYDEGDRIINQKVND